VQFASVQEIEVVEEDLPESVVPEFVRIKLRKTYRDGPFLFVLTKVWQDADSESAERRMLQDEPQLEVEVEIIDLCMIPSAAPVLNDKSVSTQSTVFRLALRAVVGGLLGRVAELLTVKTPGAGGAAHLPKMTILE
jgi:hypothetical protein